MWLQEEFIQCSWVTAKLSAAMQGSGMLVLLLHGIKPLLLCDTQHSNTTENMPFFGWKLSNKTNFTDVGGML
jgi:hypothetical protein